MTMVVAHTGRMWGKRILTKTCQALAPSRAAASSSSRGTDSSAAYRMIVYRPRNLHPSGTETAARTVWTSDSHARPAPSSPTRASRLLTRPGGSRE